MVSSEGAFVTVWGSYRFSVDLAEGSGVVIGHVGGILGASDYAPTGTKNRLDLGWCLRKCSISSRLLRMRCWVDQLSK